MVGQMQKYLFEIVRVDIIYTGILSSVPFLFMWLFSVILGFVADVLTRRKLMTITQVRKMFTGLAAFGPAVFTMGASYAECVIWLVVLCFSGSLALMGAWYPGMKLSNSFNYTN